ncbi:MAG: beta-galactosidase [Ruminococcus sp.]
MQEPIFTILLQDDLTGAEIAFGGDLIRSLKQDNYLVIETEAQGFPGWTPYKGQLRLQAYSHPASGANSVMYWHWHSIHNSLRHTEGNFASHDFQEMPLTGKPVQLVTSSARLGKHLVNLKKKNEVAVLVSNEALISSELVPNPEQAPARMLRVSIIMTLCVGCTILCIT